MTKMVMNRKTKFTIEVVIFVLSFKRSDDKYLWPVPAAPHGTFEWNFTKENEEL